MYFTLLNTSCFILTVVLIFLKIYIKFTTGWCDSQVCLRGKTVLITGANSGIGFQTALDLAKRGARVILACRSKEKAKKAYDRIVRETNNYDILYKIVDLSSIKSIRSFVQDIISNEKQLDVLINNAGAGGLNSIVTEDGLLATMQINYFAPFLLTNLLLRLLMKADSGRVINVSSIVAKYATVDIDKLNEYKGDIDQYLRSKLCLNLFTIELASRLKYSNILVYSLHPGVVRTELFRTMPYLMRRATNFIIDTFGKSAVEGAQTSIYLTVSNTVKELNGEHFHDCHPVSRYSTSSETLAKQLWRETMEILKFKDNVIEDFKKTIVKSDL